MSEEQLQEKSTFSFSSLLPSLGTVTIEIPAKKISFSITGFILFIIAITSIFSVYDSVDFNKLIALLQTTLK